MTELNPSIEQELTELARASRILELEGHGDMSLGHVSLRDPGGRGFWMKRNRIGLGEVLGPADFVLVTFDGEKIDGEGGRHSEWPIHSEIFRNRPDVQVVAHTHPFYCSVLSASSEPLLPFTLEADYFIEVPRHEDDVALITTREEGQSLAKALGWPTTGSPSAARRSRTLPASACSSRRRPKPMSSPVPPVSGTRCRRLPRARAAIRRS
jgi:L-fuculose-phosphate aldolase